MNANAKQATVSAADYYAELTDDKPIERTLELNNGKSKTVYFRRLTGGEQVILQQGIRFKSMGKNKSETIMELQDVTKRQYKQVLFMNVHEDGTQVFKTEKEVSLVPKPVLSALIKFAEEINKDDEAEDLGKGSSSTQEPASS